MTSALNTAKAPVASTASALCLSKAFFRLNEGHPLFGFLNLDFGVSGGFLLVKWAGQRQNVPRQVDEAVGPRLTLRPESIRRQRRIEDIPLRALGHADVFMINVLRG